MKIEAQGRVFEFSVFALRRGCWVFRMVSINGVPCKDYGSDPFSNERECRAAARDLAENGYEDSVYGWFAKVTK